MVIMMVDHLTAASGWYAIRSGDLKSAAVGWRLGRFGGWRRFGVQMCRVDPLGMVGCYAIGGEVVLVL